MPSLQVAPAEHDDVEQVVALADARRREYDAHQRMFWRPAKNATDVHRSHLHGLVDAVDHEFLVSRDEREVRGYIIGRLVPAPPVYDPGGLTCTVDDFAVAVVADWAAVGKDLLTELSRRAHARGAVQVVVVSGAHDEPKRRALHALGLRPASEWWVAAIEPLASTGRLEGT